LLLLLLLAPTALLYIFYERNRKMWQEIGGVYPVGVVKFVEELMNLVLGINIRVIRFVAHPTI